MLRQPNTPFIGPINSNVSGESPSMIPIATATAPCTSKITPPRRGGKSSTANHTRRPKRDATAVKSIVKPHPLPSSQGRSESRPNTFRQRLRQRSLQPRIERARALEAPWAVRKLYSMRHSAEQPSPLCVLRSSHSSPSSSRQLPQVGGWHWQFTRQSSPLQPAIVKSGSPHSPPMTKGGTYSQSSPASNNPFPHFSGISSHGFERWAAARRTFTPSIKVSVPLASTSHTESSRQEPSKAAAERSARTPSFTVMFPSLSASPQSAAAAVGIAIIANIRAIKSFMVETPEVAWRSLSKPSLVESSYFTRVASSDLPSLYCLKRGHEGTFRCTL